MAIRLLLLEKKNLQLWEVQRSYYNTYHFWFLPSVFFFILVLFIKLLLFFLFCFFFTNY